MVLSGWSERVWVSSQPVDMRKGCFSLAALVEREFSLDPRSACVFVFFARTMDKVKLLYWDRTGFVLTYKCLAKGRFRVPKMQGVRYRLSLSDLNCLLEGIDLMDKQRLHAV